MTIDKSVLDIQLCTPQDIDSIFNLYRMATDYQRTKFKDNVWPDFDPRMVEIEIAEQRQFKLVTDNQIACIWAITFNDSEIWGVKDEDPAMYLHRIATQADFRGKNLIATIIAWAKTYAKQRKKQFLRLDTCGNNTRLIAHYVKNGFDFLGVEKLEKKDSLPSHYHDADVCYFEMDLT